MKKLIYQAWIMAFLVIFQFSCQQDEQVDPVPKDPSTYDTLDISDIIGNWTATKVVFKDIATYMDVYEPFTVFTITIGENGGYCCINKCNPLFTVQQWQEDDGDYLNTFSNPDTHEKISVKILESEGSIMTADIKNLTPSLNKLFPDEGSSGHYMINFAR